MNRKLTPQECKALDRAAKQLLKGTDNKGHNKISKFSCDHVLDFTGIKMMIMYSSATGALGYTETLDPDFAPCRLSNANSRARLLSFSSKKPTDEQKPTRSNHYVSSASRKLL
jgi:hypothetical protein